jgi:hypothetical protein
MAAGMYNSDKADRCSGAPAGIDESLEPAWLPGFLCGLIRDLDTLMDAKPFRVLVRFSLAEALTTTGLTCTAGSGSLSFEGRDGWHRGWPDHKFRLVR